MRKKTFIVPALIAGLAVTSLGCNASGSKAEGTGSPDVSVPAQSMGTLAEDEVALERNIASNPIGGYDTDGNLIYGGDPAIMVDGDTVYLYTGRDVAKGNAYSITGYICYSSKDLKEWKYEGPIMEAKDISWRTADDQAWAAQTIKYKDKYYFYYCTWDKTSEGKQSIGVAVSDSPTGPFVDKGEPIVRGTDTGKPDHLPANNLSNWNDIDPTAWIETDENGEEHRYLAWGNTIYYVCELNEDMLTVKDLNGDGKITWGTSSKDADIIQKDVFEFTEAPWIYRRQDENGKYYGKYYLFYAQKWREQSAYAMTDDLIDGTWEFGGELMPPNATSNTSHMGVFDFKGKTYFLYHNGALPGGNGYRRVANLAEVHFNEDGTVQAIPETAAGLFGNTSELYTNSGEKLSHKTLRNSNADGDYPIFLEAGSGYGTEEADAQWLFMDGKADAGKPGYVSIQSENKPGLYLTAQNSTDVLLAQDTDNTADTSAKQTFRSVKGLDDVKGISFESVAYPGNYLSIYNGKLVLSDGNDKTAATVYLGFDENDTSLRSIAARISKKQFHVGDKINTDNVKVTAVYANGTTKEVTDFTSNASEADTSKAGAQTIQITYSEGGVTKSASLEVKIVAKAAKVQNLKAKVSGKKTKTVKLTWSKASGAKGYEVYYSTKKGKGYKYIAETEDRDYSFEDTDKVLKAGKTYYFSVRSFKSFNGKTEYSAYATVKVKIKK